MKNAKKTPFYKNKNFICENCNFKCSKKSEFNRHLSTAKHLRLTHAAFGLTEKTPMKNKCENCNNFFKRRQSLFRHKKTCKVIVGESPKVSKSLQKVSNQILCGCGKIYKSKSGFYKHKTKCTHQHNVEQSEETVCEIVPTNNVEYLLKALLEKNNDILEENKILREKISNMEIGNTYHNQTNNNQFNINMFLNEKCKNAMNLEDFIEKIKLSIEDLQFTKDNGYAKGISNIFIKNLNDMDVTERPIHCSDQKRLQFYVKNDNEWSKDSNNEKIDKSIEKVSQKQLKTIKDWIEENPDYLDSESKTEEYFTLVKSITQPNDNKNLKDIKKQVSLNVKLEKHKDTNSSSNTKDN